MRATGLNTISTYVPWNLHERKRDVYEFKGLWDIEAFIKEVHSVGLKMIVRPGPYICSEWEWGGLPAWLLHDNTMVVRSSKSQYYMDRVKKYFEKLLPLFVPYQWSQGGGPIIAYQIENEFGHYSHDIPYMTFLKQQYIQAGLTELYFTSDSGHNIHNGFLPGVFAGVNFQNKMKMHFDLLAKVQSDKPKFVAEFWDGWFDHWGEVHNTKSTSNVVGLIEPILSQGASINIYMFVGGTNFEFWNGANFGVMPTITSYDYDAAISEAGDFTQKAAAIRDLLVKKGLATTPLPPTPPNSPKEAYPSIKVKEVLGYYDIVKIIKSQLKSFSSNNKNPTFIEYMDFSSGPVGYGWMLYRTKIIKSGALSLDGVIRDRAQIMLNERQVGLVGVKQRTVSGLVLKDFQGEATLDFLVENTGRINYGQGHVHQSIDGERKGVNGHVTISGEPIENWEYIAFEFDKEFNEKLSKTTEWKRAAAFEQLNIPAAYRAYLEITGEPKDTWMDCKNWRKGIVIVNGFNLGRYWNVGPTQTLYIPAPFLVKGRNEFIIFELHDPHPEIIFTDTPVLNEPHPGRLQDEH